MLTINQKAPQINTTSISNHHINLQEINEEKVLLKFHRFSGCPVAQREIQEFIERQGELNASGIKTLIFLHSTKEKILPVYREVPGLNIIADGQKKFYRLYNTEFSWLKIFSIASWLEIFKSFFRGFFPLLNRFQGGVISIPADFLIDKKGRIADLHYGKHVGDSWTVSEVLSKAKKTELNLVTP